jgi:hypothetical protein
MPLAAHHHGVVERVFHTTISERGHVLGARFRPGGFTARFGRDAAVLTARVSPSTTSCSAAQFISTTASARIGSPRRADRRLRRRAGPTYVSLTDLVDRIRKDDRLHRVDR